MAPREQLGHESERLEARLDGASDARAIDELATVRRGLASSVGAASCVQALAPDRTKREAATRAHAHDPRAIRSRLAGAKTDHSLTTWCAANVVRSETRP